VTDHIGDDAALYALGMLDPGERERVDAHVATCDACVRLLGQAEADVLAMELMRPIAAPPVAEFKPRVEAPKPQRFTLVMRALAAVVIIALLPIGVLFEQNREMHVAMAMENDAMMRMASTPHRIVAFAGMDAKVVYGNDGSWYCVVVRGARAPVEIAWMHDGTQTMLGRATPMPGGDTAILYLPQSHRMDQLALVSGGQIVGQAQLVF
jgi:anti-sigma factor RsiW